MRQAVARAIPRRRGGAAYQEARPPSLVGQPEALAAELGLGMGMGMGMGMGASTSMTTVTEHAPELDPEAEPETVVETAEFGCQTEPEVSVLPPPPPPPPPIEITPPSPETSEMGIQVDPPEPEPVLEPTVVPAPEPELEPELESEVAEQIVPAREELARLQEEALFTGEYDSGDAVVSITASHVVGSESALSHSARSRPASASDSRAASTGSEAGGTCSKLRRPRAV